MRSRKIFFTKQNNDMTDFEKAQKQVEAKTLQTPHVSIGLKPVDYFSYQLAVHMFNLKIMGSGMTCKGITFTQIKKYYGLTGKSAKDCVPQLQQIFDDYKIKQANKFLNETNTSAL